MKERDNRVKLFLKGRYGTVSVMVPGRDGAHYIKQIKALES